MQKKFSFALTVARFSLLFYTIQANIYKNCNTSLKKNEALEFSQKQIIKQYGQKNSEVVSVTQESETKRVILKQIKNKAQQDKDLNLQENISQNEIQNKGQLGSQISNTKIQNNQKQENIAQKLQEKIIQNTSNDKQKIQGDRSNINMNHKQDNDIDTMQDSLKDNNQDAKAQILNKSEQDQGIQNTYGYGNFIVQKFNDLKKQEKIIDQILNLRQLTKGTQNYAFCRIEEDKLYIVLREQRQNMSNEINQIRFEALSELNKLQSLREILQSLIEINRQKLTHKNIYPERILYNENRLLPLQLDITDQLVQQEKDVLILHAEIQPPEYQFLSQHQMKEEQMIYSYGITIILMLYGKNQIEQLYQINIEEMSKNQNDETQLQLLHGIYEDQLKQKNCFPKAIYSPGFFKKLWFQIKKFLGFKTKTIIFNFKELIMQMISIDPEKRPTFNQIDEKFQQFLNKYDQNDEPYNNKKGKFIL